MKIQKTLIFVKSIFSSLRSDSKINQLSKFLTSAKKKIYCEVCVKVSILYFEISGMKMLNKTYKTVLKLLFKVTLKIQFSEIKRIS